MEITQAALEHRVDVFARWLVICTAGVVLGLMMEYGGEWAKAANRPRRIAPDSSSALSLLPRPDAATASPRITKPKFRWIALWILIGGLLIVGGVAGELYAEFFAARAENSLRQLADDNLARIVKEAGDAKTSAKLAHDEANAVAQEADSISGRLSVASVQLDQLERETLPRWRLLERGKRQFIEALEPFAGQKVGVIICGQDDSKRWPFEQILINLFRDAKWQPDLKPWPGCPTSLTGGNEMYFVSTSRAPVREVVPYDSRNTLNLAHETGVAPAAKALCDALNKLGIGTIAFMEVPLQTSQDNLDAQWARFFYGMGTTGSPGELAFENPTTIFIQIGPE